MAFLVLALILPGRASAQETPAPEPPAPAQPQPPDAGVTLPASASMGESQDDAVPAPVPVQALDSPEWVYPSRSLRIPFTARDEGVAASGVSRVDLEFSTDGGITWQTAVTARPDAAELWWTAPADGAYAFRLVSYDEVGNREKVDQHPQFRVVVDTVPPVVKLESPGPDRRYRAAADMTLRWKVQDANLEALPVRVLYSLGDQGDWKLLEENLPAQGERKLSLPAAVAEVKVQVVAVDQAGNLGKDSYHVASDKIYPGIVDVFRVPALAPVSRNRRVEIAYSLREPYKTGIQEVRLWVTRDPETRVDWNEAPGRQTGDQIGTPFVYDVPADGRYGFYLVARYAEGFASSDDPGLWQNVMTEILVDTTPPSLELLSPLGGEMLTGGEVFDVSYKVRDNVITSRRQNQEMLAMSFSSDGGESWTELRMDAQAFQWQDDHTGVYGWRLPFVVGNRFVLTLSATDLAGNRVEARSNLFEVTRPQAMASPEIEGRPRPVDDTRLMDAKLAWASHEEANLERAVEILTGLLADDSSNFEALALMGNCLYELHRVDDAIVFWERASRVEPRNVIVQFNIAQAQVRQRKFSSAEQVYLRMAREASLSRDQQEILFRRVAQLAGVYEEAQDPSKARELWMLIGAEAGRGGLEGMSGNRIRVPDEWFRRARREIERLGESLRRTPENR